MTAVFPTQPSVEAAAARLHRSVTRGDTWGTEPVHVKHYYRSLACDALIAAQTPLTRDALLVAADTTTGAVADVLRVAADQYADVPQ